MALYRSSCVLVFLLTAWAGIAACPTGWTKFNGNCYSFNTTKLNWFHAAKACRDQDAWLVDITSKAEEDFLRARIKHLHVYYNPQTLGYWTGGNDLDVEGQWVWGYPSGTPLTTTDWFPGEPNNIWYDHREEDCVVLWGHDSHDYQWNDQPCDIQDFFVCKTEDATGIVG